jgi:acylphosphatase
LSEDDVAAVHLLVSGHVQGVGFRYFVKQAADSRGLAGWVRNLRDGRVECVLVGPAAAVDLVAGLVRRGPRGARVDEVVTRSTQPGERAAAARPLTQRPTV